MINNINGERFSFGNIDSKSLLDSQSFNKLAELSLNEASARQQVQYNYCRDCSLPMELLSNEYHCKYCGLTQINDSELGKCLSDVTSNTVTGGTGARYYCVNNDYTKTQYKMILDQLNAYKSQYNGSNIPENVIAATARDYNNIQQNVTDPVYDTSGNQKGERKFVRRAAQKNSVLAAILYYECIRHQCFRKKREIANFMMLKTDGFAKGEDIVRDLVTAGTIDLPVDDESTEIFVDRYMDALNITNQKYYDFIVALVNRSEEINVGMSSQLSSKVVGAIWIVIVKCKLNISCADLEKATNNTKKSTFQKFSSVVANNKEAFAQIFHQYGIPQ